MKIIEIGTGYTSIPARIGAATEIVVEELTKVLRALSVDAQIFDVKDSERNETNLPIHEVYMPDFFVHTDVELGIIHKLKRVLYSISLTQALNHLIKNNGEELVLHFHNQYNLYFFMKMTPKRLFNNVKIAYTVHSYIWNGQWNDIKPIVKKRYFQEIYCAKNADIVFVLNKITKKHFVNKLNIPDNRIVEIVNGVNTDVYYPLPDSKKKTIKEKLQLGNNKVILQVGSVCPRKNQLTAIKLLIPILKKRKDLLYVYAGGIIDHEYKNSIYQYSFDNEIQSQVIYAGEIQPGQELNSYYNCAEALMLPSTQEAFSLVILEAMSSGIPVVMDSNNSMEVDDQLQRSFIYYDSPESFEHIVYTQILSKTKQKEHATNSRDIAVSKFSWNAVAKDYYRQFNDISDTANSFVNKEILLNEKT